MSADRTRAGMLLFIVSEANFFLLLVGAYVYYHRAAGAGPTAAGALDPWRTGLFSLALFGSSATVWRAGAAARERRPARLRAWLAATIALGALFLTGQGAEYARLLRDNVTISRNLFGTTFFTLTGFHGLHVLVGLLMLAVLLGLSWSEGGHEPTRPAVEGISLYWHFVDAVWVVIFTVVYLWRFA